MHWFSTLAEWNLVRHTQTEKEKLVIGIQIPKNNEQFILQERNYKNLTLIFPKDYHTEIILELLQWHIQNQCPNVYALIEHIRLASTDTENICYKCLRSSD